MSCPAFEERIARYVGGDLAPEESRPVVQHLATCAACAELASGLERDRLWLSSRPPETAETDYAAMRSRIRREIVVRKRNRRLLPALLAAAAILLAVLVVTHRRTEERVVATAARIAQLPAAPVERAAAPSIQPPEVDKVRKSAIRGSGPRGNPDEGVRPTKAQPAADLTLEAAMRMFQELDPEPPPPPTGSDSPVEMRIATRDPNVTIILLQETKGDSQ
jgi:hypothetical protein